MTAVDISRRAVLNARLNARLNGVRVRALRGDLFAPVAGERFDLIVANPPYVPAQTTSCRRGGVERAWEGGVDGRVLRRPPLREAPRHLTPDGSVADRALLALPASRRRSSGSPTPG